MYKKSNETNIQRLNKRIKNTRNKCKKIKEDIVEKYRKLVVEKDPNFFYFIINMFHLTILLVYFIYPLFFKMDKKIDLFLIYFALFIMFHRTLLRGECILFLLEKWKIDKNYKPGQNKYGPGWHYLGKITNIDFYTSDNNSFPKIYLNIRFKDFDTLLDAREKSLKLHKSAQYLIEKKRVPAELIYKGKKYKTRIRLKGDKLNDQKRVMSPREAFDNGATSIVMGRSLIEGNIKNNIQKLIESLK